MSGDVQPEREQGQNRGSRPTYRPALAAIAVTVWVAESIAVILLLTGVIR